MASVLAALAEATRSETDEQDFTQATPTALIRHIVHTHHAYIRSELPRLKSMAERVAAKHGPLTLKPFQSNAIWRNWPMS